MKIKICGITSEKEATYLNKTNVDYAGFVFYKKSKRNIPLDKASEIMKSLNDRIKTVAVMVSPKREEFLEKEKAGFDIIQIHGNIDEEILDIAKTPIWLAINFTDEGYTKKISWLKALDKGKQDRITGIVVDSKNFGSGEAFDWNKNGDKLKDEMIKERDFILAGGLNAENVREAIKILSPDIVDVSSGVEMDKDKIGKDEKLIKEFVDKARLSE